MGRHRASTKYRSSWRICTVTKVMYRFRQWWQENRKRVRRDDVKRSENKYSLALDAVIFGFAITSTEVTVGDDMSHYSLQCSGIRQHPLRLTQMSFPRTWQQPCYKCPNSSLEASGNDVLLVFAQFNHERTKRSRQTYEQSTRMGMKNARKKKTSYISNNMGHHN
jgi:hypothetical protein